jgi:UbiD family decarboxylase
VPRKYFAVPLIWINRRHLIIDKRDRTGSAARRSALSSSSTECRKVDNVVAGKPVANKVFDLRSWIDQARAIGQLKDVAGAALEFELGAITDLNAKRGGPALLFSEFPGYDKGFRVLTGTMMNAATLGLTMGFEAPRSTSEVVDKVAEMLRATEATAADFPPEYVATGPVMENVRTGADVDMRIFPTPTWHEGDAGPYIGTGCWQMHRDPDTGWINVGTYRNQLLGQDAVGNYIGPGHHGHIIRQKYWAKRQPCPIVVGFGAHPLFFLMGGSDVPAGVDELTWAGAIGRQRVPVIKGPVTGLPIPADAEIAIEGYVTEGDTMVEGPLGEYTGYYAGGRTEQPVIRVKAVYYRNDPILVGSPPCRPPHDFSYLFSVMRSAAIKETLRKAGVQAVKAVWVSEAGSGRMWVVTSITQKFAGHAAQAAAIACTCQAGGQTARYSIVVDDDIDPFNNDDVIWALSTRSDPKDDIDILRQSWSNSLDPMLTEEDKIQKRLWNSRALINACRPFDRLATFPAVAEASPALTKATQEKWAHLFK